MSMSDWAEKEVEIACEREKSHSEEDGDCEYGCACYHSALKAYKSLMEDGHSGFSISLTKQILDRLIDRKPLTPIEDTDDIWNEIPNYNTKNRLKHIGVLACLLSLRTYIRMGLLSIPI